MNKQVLYDELSYWDDKRKEEFEKEFADEGLEYDPALESEIDFDAMFDNGYNGQQYVVTGTIGLWDGCRKGHLPKVFRSIKDAIINANNGFDGYITVSEGKYGKLLVDIVHHDGHNSLEIRELTKLGKEMLNNYAEVDEILARKGATRNVKFLKRYW